LDRTGHGATAPIPIGRIGLVKTNLAHSVDSPL